MTGLFTKLSPTITLAHGGTVVHLLESPWVIAGKVAVALALLAALLFLMGGLRASGD
ncbi:MAG: hypothetical protein HYY09_08195 [Firmicutes bacterium]|nr:hypothetical protein [Bacillota bacterium]